MDMFRSQLELRCCICDDDEEKIDEAERRREKKKRVRTRTNRELSMLRTVRSKHEYMSKAKTKVHQPSQLLTSKTLVSR